MDAKKAPQHDLSEHERELQAKEKAAMKEAYKRMRELRGCEKMDAKKAPQHDLSEHERELQAKKEAVLKDAYDLMGEFYGIYSRAYRDYVIEMIIGGLIGSGIVVLLFGVLPEVLSNIFSC